MATYNLTGQKIKNTYGQLAQVNDSNKLVDGLGNEKQIVTSSIVNFPTEVSRSAAAAGFGAGGSSAWNDITGKPSGLVSGSSQVSYNGITDVPSGIVSGAAQLPQIATNTSNISSLTAATSSYLTSLPSGVVSSSAQVDLSQATGVAANATSASHALYANSAGTAGSATTATTAAFASAAATASYVAGANVDGAVALATSATTATSASHAVQADSALTATSATTATSASYAVTASHVPGLAAPGLVSGTGTDSIKSALTTNGSSANGDFSIAIGDNATIEGNSSIAIGRGSGGSGTQEGTICIGRGSSFGDSYGIGIGMFAAGAYQGVTVGYSSQVNNYGVTIGAGSTITGVAQDSVMIGAGSQLISTQYAVAIGRSTLVNGATNAIVIGYNQSATFNNEINIGGKFQYNNGGTGEIKLNATTVVPTSTLTVTANTASVNGALSNFFSLANAGGSNLVANPTNIQDGTTYVFKVTNGQNLTWGTAYKWEGGTPPSLSAGTDIVTFVSIGGSELYGTYLTNLS